MIEFKDLSPSMKELAKQKFQVGAGPHFPLSNYVYEISPCGNTILSRIKLIHVKTEPLDNSSQQN